MKWTVKLHNGAEIEVEADRLITDKAASPSMFYLRDEGGGFVFTASREDVSWIGQTEKTFRLSPVYEGIASGSEASE